ncbi:MBL fold metallo-hydrolase [Sporobacter termitidis]|nr:MBL fold metallo-hydrolase [Sporobacter termitidis]
MKILSLKCKYTNSYFLETGAGWIMVDTDWPGTLPELRRLLKQNGLQLGDIRYLIVTHFHPDHAGIAQELKDAGITLLLHEQQVSYVDEVNVFFEKEARSGFKSITPEENAVVSSRESRQLFKGLGIEGEMICTPGHSGDSITLIVDGLCAFTGDLPAFSLIDAYNDASVRESWALIRRFHVSAIYPGHGYSYNLP